MTPHYEATLIVLRREPVCPTWITIITADGFGSKSLPHQARTSPADLQSKPLPTEPDSKILEHLKQEHQINEEIVRNTLNLDLRQHKGP